MDSTNFSRYRRDQNHRYHGGLARQSPVRLGIPSSGSWHLVVDMQGLRGTTRSSARVIPAAALRPLPPIQQGREELQRIAENLAEEAPARTESPDRTYDVFISHATEDKDEVVRPLAHALRERSVNVWYDEFELRV